MTRVLIVEDSATQAHKLRLVLETRSYHVEHAPDGQAGLERCLVEPFDLVLSDVMMPRMTGYELCRRLKQEPRTAHLPVILLTTLNEPMDIVRGLECGADNFITKPYEPEHLLERVQHLLEQRALRRPRKDDAGVELLIMGNRVTVTSEKEQMVDLLISTFDEMLRTRKREYDAKLRVEALRESQLLLQSALDALSAAIAIVDERGAIAAVNQPWRELVAVAGRAWPAAGVGMSYIELWRAAFECDADLVERALADLSAVIAGEVRAHAGEYPMRVGSGVRWFAVTATSFDGRGPRLCAIEHEDVTERKQSQEALRSSEERFRALAQTASDAIVSSDDGGKIVYFNAAATRIFGYDSSEVLERPLSVLSPEVAARAEALFAHGAEAGDRVLELQATRKDGAPFPVEVSFGPWSAQGKTFLTCILRDISQRRELETQFRHAQKMEGIGRLAGGLAHDFNNVLAAIKSCTELVVSDLEHGELGREELDEILQAADRGSSLTRQLLAFSRNQVLKPVVTDLNHVVRDFEKMLRRVIGRDISLTGELAPELWHVRVDPGQIEQVLLNLAVNARDAMPSGGTLTITTENAVLGATRVHEPRELASGDYVVLRVSDTGVGMEGKVRSRIFEPFFTTKERGRGTGLGLSTVYGIVRQSGGQVRVDSELGRGTSFEILLPACNEPLEVLIAPEPQPRVRVAASETVLLVEDDPALRRIASRILRRAGYRVMVAAHPREALELASSQSEAIDLLLTDVVMPYMSGPELAARLAESRPGLKVLFTSGYSGGAGQHASLPAGAAFIEKPFGPDSLARKVHSVLSEGSSALHERGDGLHANECH